MSAGTKEARNAAQKVLAAAEQWGEERKLLSEALKEAEKGSTEEAVLFLLFERIDALRFAKADLDRTIERLRQGIEDVETAVANGRTLNDRGPWQVNPDAAASRFGEASAAAVHALLLADKVVGRELIA